MHNLDWVVIIVYFVVITAIGLVAATALSGAIRSLLYGISARDFVSFASATALVIAIALMASLVPAWKAAKTDPLSALRHR